MVRLLAEQGLGLPPLARGAPRRLCAHPCDARPTPACAGSTVRGVRTAARSGAYPRLRGEHPVGDGGGPPDGGLPPLARGAHRPDDADDDGRGPTPACAGSTGLVIAEIDGLSAYPRLRGEHLGEARKIVEWLGLPPLARGAPLMLGCSAAAGGPTPACAGSTFLADPAQRGALAYPRLRGEHQRSAHALAWVGGLPPLARGAHCTNICARLVTRPTPACAGSTLTSDPSRARSRAYPRLRGEHHDSHNKVKPTHGPTPACAGSTAAVVITDRDVGAYPRLRGEHTNYTPDGAQSLGLPPLARGAPASAAASGCG